MAIAEAPVRPEPRYTGEAAVRQLKFTEDPVWVKEFEGRTYAFYRKATDWVKVAMGFRPLGGEKKVRVDEEGRVYFERGMQARITNPYEMFGKHQRGRDLEADPLKEKIPIQEAYIQYPSGMDVLLRCVIERAAEYTPDSGAKNNEADRITAIEAWLTKREAENYGAPVDEEDKQRFIEENRLKDPRDVFLARIARAIGRGVKDKTGKDNPLADYARRRSVALNIPARKYAISRIRDSFTRVAEGLFQTREDIRGALLGASFRIEDILQNPLFIKGWIVENTRDITHLKLILERDLIKLSEEIEQEIEARPYKTAGRTLQVVFGFKTMPGGSISLEQQVRRGASMTRERLLE